jgi:hypothetical protein
MMADKPQQSRRHEAPMNFGRVTTLICMLAAVLALSIGASAFAQSDPASTVYNPTSEVLNVVNGGGPADIVPGPGAGGEGNARPTPTRRESGGNAPTPVATTPSGSLPFTGFQAGLVALAGLALVGTGFAMRRVARSDS